MTCARWGGFFNNLSKLSGCGNTHRITTRYNGTRNFSRSAIVDFLELSGMRFGADVFGVLLQYPDDRVSKSGVIVIKAQAHRSQDMNKEDAVAKLMQLLQSASFEAKKRRATKPTFGARMDRLNQKTQHKERKKMRGKVGSFD